MKTCERVALILAIALVCLGCLGADAWAQTWTQSSPTGGPPAPRDWPGAAYDPGTNTMIIFGGSPTGNPPPLFNDVWVLSPADTATPTWTQLTPTGAPPSPRGELGGSVAYDAGSNRLILYGGNTAIAFCGGVTNDLWILTNANGQGGAPQWTPITQGNAGPTRQDPSLVYDASSDRLILFGGNTNSCGSQTNDVWVLSNANGLGGVPTWTQLAPAGGLPPARFAHTAVYNPAANSMIIFGGIGVAGALNDTWVLSNANGMGGTPTWTQLSPSGGLPPARFSQNATYDTANDRMTIFGGVGPGGYSNPQNDVWVLAGGASGPSSWTQLSPTGPLPPGRYAASMVFNPASDRATVFGGVTCPGGGSCSQVAANDVWVLTVANGSIPTTTMLTTSASTSDFGDSVTFTANVTSQSGPPSGSVTLYDGASILTTVGLPPGMPTASFTTNTLTAGAHTITAQFTPASGSGFGSSNAALMETIVSFSQFPVLSGNNTFNGNQTVNGTLSATSLFGNGFGLTNLNPANIAPGTAGISITGNAATATTAMGLTCAGCVLDAHLGVNYAAGDTKGGNALNALNSLMLGGMLPGAFAPASGSGSYVAKAGDTMTGTLNLPIANLSGSLALPSTSNSSTGVITLGGPSFAHNFGSNNTFLGTNAGNFTMSDGQNTGMGTSALTSNTSGHDNTAIGSFTLEFNTSGVQSTAVGSYALQNNTMGTSNVAVGNSALRSNTSGTQNTAAGVDALNANTTGTFNTASGVAALSLNTSGNNNTALGWQAGYSPTAANANITGSNDTFLGFNSGPGTPTQLSNATAVGANALVNCSNCMVLGDGTVNVGIGTQTPGHKLDVVGDINASSNVTTGGVFTGNGAGLTGVQASTLSPTAVVQGSQVSGAVANATNAVTAANLTGNINDTQVNNLTADLASASASAVTTSEAYANSTFLPLAGGTLSGTLNVPANGFAAGGNQFVLNSGLAGIGTSAPDSSLTVSASSPFMPGWNNSMAQLHLHNSDPSWGTFLLLTAASSPAVPWSLYRYGSNGAINGGTVNPLTNQGDRLCMGVVGVSEQMCLNQAGTLGLTGGIIAAGSVTAASFTGNGAGLTGVSASGLAAGTYGNAYNFNNAGNSFTGNGAGLTNLNASNLASGTVPVAALSGTYNVNINGNAATATAAVAATSATNASQLGGVAAANYARLDIGNSFQGNQNVSGNVSVSGNETLSGNLSISGATSTTGTVTIGTGGTPIAEHLSMTFNPNFGKVGAGVCKPAQTFTFTGASDGDVTALGVPNSRRTGGGSLVYMAWVSAPNTIKIEVCNVSGANQTINGTGAIRIDLWKH